MLSSEMLGYSPQARVLIINADDLGIYPSVNNAVLPSIEHGIAGLLQPHAAMSWCPLSARTAA